MNTASWIDCVAAVAATSIAVIAAVLPGRKPASEIPSVRKSRSPLGRPGILFSNVCTVRNISHVDAAASGMAVAHCIDLKRSHEQHLRAVNHHKLANLRFGKRAHPAKEEDDGGIDNQANDSEAAHQNGCLIPYLIKHIAPARDQHCAHEQDRPAVRDYRRNKRVILDRDKSRLLIKPGCIRETAIQIGLARIADQCVIIDAFAGEYPQAIGDILAGQQPVIDDFRNRQNKKDRGR